MSPLCEGRQTVVASLLLIWAIKAYLSPLFSLFLGVAVMPFLLVDL
jgi:hypothetical protein